MAAKFGVPCVQAALEVHPELTGCKFGDVHFRFPYATPLGILREERMSLCPPDDFIIEDGDEIMLLRKSGSMQRDALRTPLAAKPDDWVPKISAQEFSKVRMNHNLAFVPCRSMADSCALCRVVMVYTRSWFLNLIVLCGFPLSLSNRV